MNGLICAADDCLYNDKHRCISKRVNLSDHSVITVHEGRQHFWRCRNYEMSERAKQVEEQMEAILRRRTSDTAEGRTPEADESIRRFCEYIARGLPEARKVGEALKETIRRMSDAEEL